MGFFLNAYRYAVAGVQYLLKTNFVGATGQPTAAFVDGRGLDTVEEGLVVGSLTVKDGASGATTIENNELKMANSAPSYGMSGVYSQDFSRANGRIVYFKFEGGTAAVTVNGTIGIYDNTAFDVTNRVATVGQIASGLALAWDGYSSANTGNIRYVAGKTWTPNEADEFAIVILTSGFAFFVKEYGTSTWELIAVDTRDTTATLKAIAHQYNGTSYLLGMRVTDTLYPNLVQTVAEDSFTETNDTALTSHTPEKGGAWTLVWALYNGSGSAFTQTVNGTTDLVEASATTVASGDYGIGIHVTNSVASSDVLVTGTVTTVDWAGYGATGLVARADTSNNFVWADIVTDTVAANQKIRLYECTNNSLSERGATTATVAVNTAYAMSLRVVGSSIVGIFPNGSVTGTLASPTTNTRHGILGLAAKHTNLKYSKHDNFKVYPATGYSLLDSI